MIIAGTLGTPGGFYCLKWSLGIILELFWWIYLSQNCSCGPYEVPKSQKIQWKLTKNAKPNKNLSLHDYCWYIREYCWVLLLKVVPGCYSWTILVNLPASELLLRSIREQRHPMRLCIILIMFFLFLSLFNIGSCPKNICSSDMFKHWVLSLWIFSMRKMSQW